MCNKQKIKIWFVSLFLFVLQSLTVAWSKEVDEKEQNIIQLTQIYQSSMDYIFSMQPIINKKVSEEKAKLFGQKFIENLKIVYIEKFGIDFPNQQETNVKNIIRLMVLVMEDNRTLIMDPFIDFKGFIPAVFAFQLSEKFNAKGIGLKIKFTNSLQRIRNKFNAPDKWEAAAINKLKINGSTPILEKNVEYNGNSSYRYMVPVKLNNNCLTCHGSPNENPMNQNRHEKDWSIKDKTGFLMEGWKLGELGGGISVLLYEQNSNFDKK